MTVRVEKNGAVTTVIHSRAEARNAMDPASAEALTAAFLAFDADAEASVAVFWGEGGAFCAGWDLKEASALAADIARFPQLCVRADRRSVFLQHGLSEAEALRSEWRNSKDVLQAEGIAGAARRRNGRFDDHGAV